MWWANCVQLRKPWERAITNCAAVRLHAVLGGCFALPAEPPAFVGAIMCRSINSATPLTQWLTRTGIECWNFGVDALTSRLTHLSAQSSIALGLVCCDLQAFSRLLASFLYCSRLGRAGRGNASCGLGNIRSSSHYPPRVRTCEAERRFVDQIKTVQVGMALSADWKRPERS